MPAYSAWVLGPPRWRVLNPGVVGTLFTVVRSLVGPSQASFPAVSVNSFEVTGNKLRPISNWLSCKVQTNDRSLCSLVGIRVMVKPRSD